MDGQEIAKRLDALFHDDAPGCRNYGKPGCRCATQVPVDAIWQNPAALPGGYFCGSDCESAIMNIAAVPGSAIGA
jgi:hypothetical protein